jgi:hypothetical protein
MIRDIVYIKKFAEVGKDKLKSESGWFLEIFMMNCFFVIYSLRDRYKFSFLKYFQEYFRSSE